MKAFSEAKKIDEIYLSPFDRWLNNTKTDNERTQFIYKKIRKGKDIE